MTRRLHCSDPNCPHERIRYFKDWCKTNLPGSDKGLFIYDVDLVIYSKNTGRILVFETKTNMAVPSIGQRLFLRNLNNWISNGTQSPVWNYQGVHLVQFERYSFTDGRCYLDNKEISEEELRENIMKVVYEKVLQP